jgi:hypothetical protein
VNEWGSPYQQVTQPVDAEFCGLIRGGAEACIIGSVGGRWLGVGVQVLIRARKFLICSSLIENSTSWRTEDLP